MSPSRGAGRRVPAGLSLAGFVAASLAAGWLGLAGWALLTDRLPPDTALARIATALGIVLPFLLLWIAARTAGTIRALRDETGALKAEIDALRRQAPPPEPPRLPTPPAPTGPPVLAMADFLRTMDLPSDGDPTAAAALRAVARHPDTAELLAAARDLAARLARNGIRVETLAPAPVQPAIWRAQVAGLPLPASPATANAPRDPALKARVDRLLAALPAALAVVEPVATEEELRRFSDTRVARLVLLCAPATPPAP